MSLEAARGLVAHDKGGKLPKRVRHKIKRRKK
jgi:hypothetical protein